MRLLVWVGKKGDITYKGGRNGTKMEIGNKVWRRVWRDKAKEYGLTPASLIKVSDRRYDYSQGGYVTTDFLCTVGAELPENLNVFALGEDNKKQEIKIPLLGYKATLHKRWNRQHVDL